MAIPISFLHRGRRIAAKSITLGRRALAELKPPSSIETFRGVAPAELPDFLSRPGLGVFRLYTDGTFIEATTGSSRLCTVIQSLNCPLHYLDVHACARP